MSQSVHLIANNLLGCGVPEGKCLPCSGIFGKTAVISCSILDHHRTRSHFKLRGLKCSSARASFVCDARRNPDFSRQNKHRYSRSRNMHNEERDSFRNFEEDMLSSKNGPLVSLTNTPKSQATAAPGPKEKEIVELFRKVQARLRDRATKEENKVEASQGKGKENGTVDSLLKLLRKHSIEQVKRSSGNVRQKEFRSDQFEEGGQSNARGSTRSSDSDSKPEPESVDINTSSVTRPTSKFQRRSPVPRKQFSPVSYDDDEYDDDDDYEDVDVLKTPLSIGAMEENQDQTSLKFNAGSEQKLDPKDELFYPDVGIADVSENGDSHDSGQTYNDESGERRQVVQNDDLSALKLPELRALAKSRGIKGFSKMKKGELMELLSES